MRVGTQIFVSVLMVGAVAVGWQWLGSATGEPAQASQRPSATASGTLVLVDPLSYAEDQVVVRAVGTVDAWKSAAIHPSAAGQVVEVNFEAGQRVKKDDVLLRLDDVHQRLSMRLAEVELGEARREVVRLEELAVSGSVAKAGLETAQAALQSASLRLSQAAANLDDRIIVAPFDGVVGLSEIEVGDRISTDTQIATLDDRSALLVDFNVSESFAGQIKPGDVVAVHPTMSEHSVQGVITSTASRIDAVSRTLRVRARIDNPEEAIRPGASVAVEFKFTGNSYPRIREVAVLWSRDGAYVWRASEDKAEKVFVKLIRRDRGHVLVDGPLAAGDLIIVEGVQGLRPGQLLEPVAYGAQSAPVESHPPEIEVERS